MAQPATIPEAAAGSGVHHVGTTVAWAHALACGARPVRPNSPVDIEAGPDQGAKAAPLRIHENVALELFQPVRRRPNSK